MMIRMLLRTVMMCHNRAGVVDTLKNWNFDPQSQHRVHVSCIAHLPFIMYSYLDFPLISVFIERWQAKTNTFHLPFGQMTIMLHDVWQIIGVPVDGRQ